MAHFKIDPKTSGVKMMLARINSKERKHCMNERRVNLEKSKNLPLQQLE